MRIFLFILTFALLVTLGNLAESADIECPIIADTLLAGHSSENNMNCGARAHLRVKGYQGIVLFRFDMSEVGDARIEGATLSAYCVQIGGDAAGKTMSEAISTIAHDWIEGVGDYTPDEDSATFLWPGEAIAETWGEEDNENSNRFGEIDVLDVVGGFGGSIANEEGLWEFRDTEWTDIELDAELAQGLVDGTQYGIAVMRNTVGVNLDLASREHAGGAFAAELVVHASGYAVKPEGKLVGCWAATKAR